MTLIYADTSALIRAYFVDEPDHDDLYALLLEGNDPVVISELGRVEFASAVRAANGDGRLSHWRDVLARFDADCQMDGPLALLRLRPEVIMPAAYRLVLEHRLRTLDALHLAVAVEDCPGLVDGGEVTFVTRDDDQAAAAAGLGMTVG